MAHNSLKGAIAMTDETSPPGWPPRSQTWPRWLPDASWNGGLTPPASPNDPAGVQSGPVWVETPSGGLLALHPNGANWVETPNGGLLAVHPQPRIPAERGGSHWWDSIAAAPAMPGAGGWPSPNPTSTAAPSASPSQEQPKPENEGAAISTTEDLLRTTPAALARGTTMALGGTGDARELARKGLDWVLQKLEATPETAQRVKEVLRSNSIIAALAHAPTSEQLQRALEENVTGPLYQPQTQAGKYLNTGLEFVPGAIAGGPLAGGLRAIPGAALRYGFIPGLISEAAGQATEGTAAEPWARAAAALGTGGLAAFTHPTAPRGAAAKSPTDLSAGLYEPPTKPPRPFSADYPSGAPADSTGRLLTDIEGRPLDAKYIAGRRVVGGADEALTPKQVEAAIKEATGRAPREASNQWMDGNAGLYRTNYRRGGREIFINEELMPQQKELTTAHEAGHMVDDIVAGRRGIPTKGLENELEDVYSTLNTGSERTRPRERPQDQGYSDKDAPFEFTAEAMRSYLTNPNYFKTVAPRTAAAIRAWVNSHPQLSKVIQFNSLGGLAVAGEIGATSGDESNL
jgi:hypothetical protein